MSPRRSAPRPQGDHGTEFTSKALDEWAYRREVALDFIRHGKPVENALTESLNVRSASVRICNIRAGRS